MILTITGPSGVGKTTLLNGLMDALSGSQNLEAYTTRDPRPTDENYCYVSDHEFDAMEARGEFLWTAHPHGKKYGTRKFALDQALASPDINISVLVIDAVKKLHTYAPGLVVSFYIHIDDEAELRRRFSERNDMPEDSVEARIAECKSWYEEAQKSGVPFIYVDGKKSREELVKDVLTVLKVRV